MAPSHLFHSCSKLSEQACTVRDRAHCVWKILYQVKGEECGGQAAAKSCFSSSVHTVPLNYFSLRFVWEELVAASAVCVYPVFEA